MLAKFQKNGMDEVLGKYKPKYKEGDNFFSAMFTNQPRLNNDELDFLMMVLGNGYHWRRIEHGDDTCTIEVKGKGKSNDKAVQKHPKQITPTRRR